MIEFDVKQMSERDMIEAANEIFTTQEKDFEKIRSEKWYQNLFHAITLNQDGKKYTVRGIRSLTKLQNLFMSIYVKNYRNSLKQLDTVIEAVIKNSEEIKKLYGMCVLNIEEQESLESLCAQDAEILALFLGEYRDENGSVPDMVRDYNKGVLVSLNRKVPTGSLDNHQIRRLKAPKIVYRCFMEQCAIDGTIDSQEWVDKIYEDLKDFELSENSKNEIKESVKYEAEIAGVDYFLVKYSNNMGILETDFEIDLRDNTYTNKETEWIEQQIEYNQLLDIVSEFLNLDYYSMENFSLDDIFKKNYTSIISVPDSEIQEDIDSGIIEAQVLRNSIGKSMYSPINLLFAYKLCFTDDKFNEHKTYLLIATLDGVYFFIEDSIVKIGYDDIFSVVENNSTLKIVGRNKIWYNNSGAIIAGNDKDIEIKKNNENRKFLRKLKKTIENIMIIFGKYVYPSENKIEDIVKKYIKDICESASATPYIVSDWDYNDEKNNKRLKKALSKYAIKVRQDEVIGFIDTSFFGNGGDGILFSKQGMAFDYGFEKIFARYEEIESMYIKKGKSLVLSGIFSERKNNNINPEITNTYFNLNALKECLEEISCVI